MSNDSKYLNPKGLINPSSIEHGLQLPRNSSVSFTLKNAFTETSIKYEGAPTEGSIKFFFDGELKEDFGAKVKKLLEQWEPLFPFLSQLHLEINSSNSFPHSTGIASSASSMSALALCLCSLEEKLLGSVHGGSFLEKASYVARLGSGSACRSVFPQLGFWGEHQSLAGSSDLYAVGIADEVNPIFHTFHDDILIVSSKPKSVSSTAGHNLMNDHPFGSERFDQAKANIHHIMLALESGDVNRAGQIIEQEALSLHALMMTSNPSYILMKGNTLEMIDRIRAFREERNQPIFFSLDAGPNIHLLYPAEARDAASELISDRLFELCEQGKVIKDEVGQGPVKLPL